MNGSPEPWPRGRGRDGGIDAVPLPAGATGRLLMCGKHAIGPDPAAVIANHGVDTVVCLTERFELADRYPEYTAWLDAAVARHARAIWFPIPDLHAPALEPLVGLVAEIERRLCSHETVLVHCAAGFGRAGTIVACVLVALGMRPDEAVAHVAAHRPMAGPEVGAQRELVTAFAAR